MPHPTRIRPGARLLLAGALAALALLLPTRPVSAEPYVSCATPRQATMTFINNLQEDNLYPEAATACFDWAATPSLSPADRQQRVRQLLAVFDARGHFIHYERIPDSADHRDAESGWEKVALIPDDLPAVYLTKQSGVWLFSQETVSATPRLYDATFPLGLERLALELLPRSFQNRLLGVAWWQVLAIALLLLAAIFLGKLVEIFAIHTARRLIRRTNLLNWGEDALQAARWPITLSVAGGLVLPFITELALPVRLALILNVAARTVVTGAVVVLLFRMIDALASYLERRAARTDTRLDDQLVPLIRKSLKAALAIIATLFILQNLDVDVASLLAGLGLGGLAFALAAKDTLANMFGSLTIFLDRPFQIGDWIKVSGVEGTVEEVGFRSTRIRTFDKALVTVPNSTIANAIIDNMSERPLRRLKMTIGLTYDATPEQLQAYCEGVRAILQANPGIYKDAYEVHLYAFGPHALEILVYTFLDVASWTEELLHRHNILLECIRLADALGVSFAFPTQTLHIETLPGARAEHPPLPDADALRRTVERFGPGGELARPRGLGLVPGGFMPDVGSRRGGDDA